MKAIDGICRVAKRVGPPISRYQVGQDKIIYIRGAKDRPPIHRSDKEKTVEETAVSIRFDIIVNNII